MSRSSTVRKPRSLELRQLHHLLEGSLHDWQRRRAETLLLHAAGVAAHDIARLLEVHPHTTYADLWAFQRHGLDSIRQSRRQGAPARLTRAQIVTIWRLVQTPPYELGLPYGRWSLHKLRAYLLRRRILKAISREHLRRLLQKGGSPSAACSVNRSAPTHAATPSWPASGPAGGTVRVGASCCSSTSSRSRSRPTAGDATRVLAAWCCRAGRRRVGGSTCF